MSLHDNDTGTSLPDPAQSNANTSTQLPVADNNPEMSLANTVSQDMTSEPHPPVVTHHKRSRERKIAAKSQMSNRVSQTPAKVSMDGVSDAPTSNTQEARKIPEILDDKQSEPRVKQEQLNEETTSLQSVKKSAPAKRQVIARCDDSDEEVVDTGTESNMNKKKAAKHGPDSEGNGDKAKPKKKKAKISALDTLGISDKTLTESKAVKSKKTPVSKSVRAKDEDDGDVDEDDESLATQGSSARAQGSRRLNHGDEARKTTTRIYSTKREAGHWPESCSLTQTKARNIHKKLRDSGDTLLADVAQSICFLDEIYGVKPHNGYVSKIYLKSIAPGEYNEKGFVRGSSLKKLKPWQVEETLGVPYVFFRATDENLALIRDDEDLDEVLKGRSPRAKDNNKRKDTQTSTVSAQPLKRVKIDDDQGDFSVAPEFAQSTPAMASASERMTQEANKLELLHLEYDNISTNLQQSGRSIEQSASVIQTIAAYAKENTGRNLVDIEEYIKFMDKNGAHVSLRESDSEAGRVWQALTRGYASLNDFGRALTGSSAQTTLSDEQGVAQSELNEDGENQDLVNDHEKP